MPADALVGGSADAGLPALFAGLNPERITVAAMGAGTARYALERASSYVATRKVWGRPIGTHQGVAHPLAHAGDPGGAGPADDRQGGGAATTPGRDLEAGVAANMAKYASSEAAALAVDTAIQVHGGNGMTTEYGVATLLGGVRAGRIAPGQPGDDPQLRRPARAGPGEDLLTLCRDLGRLVTRTRAIVQDREAVRDESGLGELRRGRPARQRYVRSPAFTCSRVGGSTSTCQACSVFSRRALAVLHTCRTWAFCLIAVCDAVSRPAGSCAVANASQTCGSVQATVAAARHPAADGHPVEALGGRVTHCAVPAGVSGHGGLGATGGATNVVVGIRRPPGTAPRRRPRRAQRRRPRRDPPTGTRAGAASRAPAGRPAGDRPIGSPAEHVPRRPTRPCPRAGHPRRPARHPRPPASRPPAPTAGRRPAGRHRPGRPATDGDRARTVPARDPAGDTDPAAGHRPATGGPADRGRPAARSGAQRAPDRQRPELHRQQRVAHLAGRRPLVPPRWTCHAARAPSGRGARAADRESARRTCPQGTPGSDRAQPGQRGGRPAISAYSVAHSEYTSAAGAGGAWRNISGGAYAGVSTSSVIESRGSRRGWPGRSRPAPAHRSR